MIARVTLAGRISLIILMSLAAVWIASIALVDRAQVANSTALASDPARIAALAALLETGAGSDRALVLRAVTSPQFEARLVPAGQTLPPPGGAAVNYALRQNYLAALAGRSLQITIGANSAFERRWPRLAFRTTDALEVRILLRSGDTLIVNEENPLLASRAGLPVGFGAGLFGTLVAITALLIMQRETKPLARLAAAVDRVDLGADPENLPDGGSSAPEIRAVIAAFNRLQARLAGLLRARMALIGGISHDVKTFATRLRLRLDSIPDEAERARAAADIADMIGLLDDAVLSSRGGAGELIQEMVEFAALVEGEVADRQSQGDAVTLAADPGAAAAVVLGERLALRRVVANIVDNAIKYGGVAELRLSLARDVIVLTVEDRGPGIPAGQRDLMLEPFARLETSRNRGTGGAGLGLAIARTLAEAHGGGVAIGDAPSGGARVMVTLPVFQSHKA